RLRIAFRISRRGPNLANLVRVARDRAVPPRARRSGNAPFRMPRMRLALRVRPPTIGHESDLPALRCDAAKHAGRLPSPLAGAGAYRDRADRGREYHAVHVDHDSRPPPAGEPAYRE